MTLITIVFIILTVTLFIHLLEEIFTGFRTKFPFGEIPKKLFISINIALYMYSLLTIFLLINRLPIAIPFVWFFVILQILNILGHIIFMVKNKGYFPGGYTTLPLGAASIYLIYLLMEI